MALAHQNPSAPSPAAGIDAHLIGLFEVGLAGLNSAAEFSAAAVLLCLDGQQHALIATSDPDGASDLLQAAAVALVSLAGDTNSDCLPAGDPLLLRLRPGGPPLAGPPAATQDAPVVIGGIVRGVIRLAWAESPSQAGAAGLYAVAQALSGALEREMAATSLPAPAFVQLADAVEYGLVLVEGGGTATGLNGAGTRLLQALGGSDGGAAPAALVEALETARSEGSPVVREVAAQTPESRHITVAALPAAGGGIVALQDHTEERLLQERLLQSEKMASVGQLVSGVAHELNNPLTGVIGFAQLLLASDLNDSARSQVETIYGEAERAAKIVQNLLSFARRRRPTKEMADVNALLQRVLELRSYDFTIRNISLDMTLDPRATPVWVDPDQIQQVFFNVIKNAEQAMIEANSGGKLTVMTRGLPTGVRISVADDGPGIPPDIQRRIFDPFFTTKDADQGTGLGLTICYSIIDEHGGRIWPEAAASGGTVFHIELPAGVAEERPAGSGEAAMPGASPGAVMGRRVLVVDDEESIRALLQEILRLDRHLVSVASTGREAADRVAREHFDVIITDMKMPGMDGASFYREVRASNPALAKRIIFITGDTVSPDTRAFLQRVSNPVLSKPFKIGPLREAIESVLAGE